MKRLFLLMLVSMILLLTFTSCSAIKGIFGGEDTPDVEVCEHSWEEATCRKAKSCTLCGEREGTPLPHKLVDATCTEPKHCTVCGQTYGEALGHNMSLSSCTVPSTCRRCGLTDGEAPGHAWTEANCTIPKTCRNCMTVEGEALGHNYVTNVVEATCYEGGATTHTCSNCGDTYTENIVEALGHLNDVILEAVPPTCTETGLTAGVGCSRCGEHTTNQRVLASLGHNSTSTVVPPTCTEEGYTAFHCTVCGEDYKAEYVPMLGHNYGDALCTDAAVCTVCGFDNGGEPIGHDWKEATCTEPKMCKREGCGLTEGEPLGHNMSEGSCLAPSTCLNGCGHVVGEKKTHVLTYSMSNGVVTYTCKNCGSSFVCETGYVLDGQGYDGMVGVNNTLNGYITNPDKPQYPVITEEGYYELLQIEDTGAAKQLQIWVPEEKKSSDNFSSGSGSVGFYSFKLNGYMDTNFGMQLIDGSSSGGRWSADWCIIDKPFNLTPPTKNEEGREIVTAIGWDNLILYEVDVTDADSKFTGWFEVVMGIVLDVETDTISIYYYVNGQFIGWGVRPLTTLTNAINCVYISGNTQAAGSGIMIDDIAFGYTQAGSWVFDDHAHTWTAGEKTAPTCASDGYTTYSCHCGVQCRLDLVTALGHKDDIIIEGVAPTCTEEGLTAGVKCSVCNEITKAQKVISPLGHTEEDVPALNPTCTENGHSASKICTVCNEYTTEITILPALGHSYVSTGTEATCTDEGFMTHKCSVCGHSYDEVLLPNGHDYGDAHCTETAVCLVCNTPSDGPIGHNFAPATCTEPSTCTRGCNTTVGEPLGHNMKDATCLELSTCDRCGHTEGELAPHNIEHKFVKGVLTYYCSVCDNSYLIDHVYYLDGSSHDSWVARGNAQNYTVSTGHYPAIVDGHYELINKTGRQGQMQIWIPNEHSEQLGFTAADHALGYLSFKFNASLLDNQGIDFKLVDSISNQGDNRWQPGGVASLVVAIKPLADGHIKLVADDGTEIANIAVGEDNFTGWIDFKVAIELNGEFDQITLHYMINGKHVYSMSKELTTVTNSINSVYLSGYTTAKGSGIMLDDVAFGFSANGEYKFDTCDHSFVDATCSAPKYCSVCGYIESGAIGHQGGNATCDTLAVCEFCGESYGDYKHNMNEATCYEKSVCLDCGKIIGDYKPHNVILTHETGKLKYSCSMCGAYYYVDTFYYVDGTDRNNTTTGLAENYATDNGQVLIATDETTGNKYYEFLKIDDAVGKAELWVPAGHPNAAANYWTGFSVANQAVGFISFKFDAYTDVPGEHLKLQLADHNVRSISGANFWTEGALPTIFEVCVPASDGDKTTTTIKGWDGLVLKVVEVGNDKFTGWIDVKIALVMNVDNTVTAHYYINGEYVNSVTKNMNIITGEITAAYFYARSGAIGSGYKLDDIAFGYSVGSSVVPGLTPGEDPDPTPDPEPELRDETFEYTGIAQSEVKSYVLKTIVASKIKQCDQANPGSDLTQDYFSEGGTPSFVKAKRSDGTEVEALYFSRSVPWLANQKVHFTEFRFAVNSEQPGAFVTKITFDYIVKGTVEKNDRYTFTDIEGNKFSADAYVQIKTPTNHPLAGDNYPELQGTDLILDGAWHTMTIDFGSDGIEIIDILLNLYHFQGEMMIANINVEYRN